MKSGLGTLFRLAWRTYFPGDDPLARRTWKRLFVMSLFLPVFSVVQVGHWCALLLDEILFRGYRQVDVKRPLFHCRSSPQRDDFLASVDCRR